MGIAAKKAASVLATVSSYSKNELLLLAADMLIEKTLAAAEKFGYKTIAVAGGVSANSGVRAALSKACSDRGFEFYMPELSLCGDNAAMIGVAGYYEYQKGVRSSLDLNAVPNLKLGER